MGLIIGLVLGYLIGMPILLQLIHIAHKKIFIQRKMEKAGRNAKPEDFAQPLMPRIRERLSFTIKDKRPVSYGGKKEGKEAKEIGISRKMMMIVLWAVGFIIFVVGGIAGIWILLPIGIFMFFMSIVFGYKSSKDVLETRKKILQRMYNIGRTKLGINSEHGPMNQVVKVLEWDEYINPKKVEYFIPDTFASEGEEGFLRQFNQLFGNTTAWVPSDDPETHEPGWNYDKGKATFHAVPPLPTSAPWSEHYVKHPAVAWSFFPLAIGVENGIELPNPETGEIENVLGFDLSGEQMKVGEANGIKVSPTITTSPMALVGGGTGGGKSLNVKTKVLRLKK